MLRETRRYQNEARIRRRANTKGLAKERVNERTEALLKVLAQRGLAVTDHQRWAIHRCIELVWLEQWLDRATSVTSVSELLGEMQVDELLDVLGAGRRALWSALHQRAYEQGFAQGFAEAYARSQALALLKYLGMRGLPVTARQRRKIRECADLAILARWFDRMGSVQSVGELLSGRRAPVR